MSTTLAFIAGVYVYSWVIGAVIVYGWLRRQEMPPKSVTD